MYRAGRLKSRRSGQDRTGRRGGVVDLQAHAFAAVVAIQPQGACDMQDRLGRIEQRAAKLALAGAEGDRLDAAALVAHQGAADMSLAHRLRVIDSHAGQGEAWQGIAGAERARSEER